ncbi:ketopantoate reductase family protein [Streptomyces werraensis]|uniref:ketopantoate reductase family protein n=1 Tax=Streptomyces werraensis TaxID=68284 RepID=UPI001CE383A9
MTEPGTASVCIVGAGSTGVLLGHDLSRTGVAITYLVRPHRQKQLSRPQTLYSYDDGSLKTYSGYDVMIDPAELTGTSFDFVVVTLDGAALRAEAGKKLVDEMGRAFRSTPTRVILFSVGVGLRSWFLERSGLADAQVTGGGTGLHVHEAQHLALPPRPGVDADLLAEADYAYRRRPLPHDFIVTDSAPQVAHDFAALWDGNTVSKCAITPTGVYELGLAPLFATFMACELLDWPSAADVDPADETWQLGIDARREILRLSMYGPAGRAASEQLTAEGVLGSFREWEQAMLPLDLPEFNRYHHGGKMNRQDRRLIDDVLRCAEEEGVEMPALRALTARLRDDASQESGLAP